MQKRLKKLQIPTLLILLLSFTMACKDDEAPTPTVPTSGNQTGIDSTSEFAEVNDWIYSMMEELYYWNDQLPAQPNKNQGPKEFFDGLLSDEDRFSVIVPNYQDLMNSLNGVNMEAGYEFQLVRPDKSAEDVEAVLLYVKNNSPAAQAGLKRGDVITGINGSAMNLSNYKSLVGKTYSDHSITYKRYNSEAGEFEIQPDLSLGVVQLAENPHFLDTVYTIEGKKIGYYVYNFFSPGSGKEYDLEMDQIISDFRSKGITDIVLDLRYNSGGAVSSAKNLGSLLGRGVDKTKIFYENRWNAAYQEYWEGRAGGDDILRGKFLDKAEKIGDKLTGKLYVLVGSRTASASEMIINGLKPYMDVYLVGEKTVGKNVGSIPVEDSDNPDNEYGILPIVFQVYNSQGFSDYSKGFIPDAELRELDHLPFKQLGDVEEPLLARAIADITGVNARVKSNENARISSVEALGSSIDAKPRTNRLIFDLPVTQE